MDVKNILDNIKYKEPNTTLPIPEGMCKECVHIDPEHFCEECRQILQNNNLTNETIKSIDNEITFDEIAIENPNQVTFTMKPQDTWVGYPGINK